MKNIVLSLVHNFLKYIVGKERTLDIFVENIIKCFKVQAKG